MNFLANEMDVTASDLILPVILLVGFIISVTIGILVWRTWMRDHKDQESSENRNKPT